MSTFAETFRAIVMPRLQAPVRFHGWLVAAGVEEFRDAYGAVMSEARRRGASYLPDHLVASLDDWITTTLLNAIVEFEPSIDAYRASVARVSGDIAQWDQAVSAWASESDGG